MDKELENFISRAREIKMTEREKEVLRAKISNLPIPSPLSVVKSPYLSRSPFGTLGKALVAACLVVILGGGSLSYAAEKALPGDLLYPIKVKFNEEAVAAFKLTPESKIAWQEKIIERRLTEIKTLRGKNHLDEKKRDQIEKNLEKHKKEAEKIKDGHNINIDSIILKVERGRQNLGEIIRQDEKSKINHSLEQNRPLDERPWKKEKVREQKTAE